MKKCILMALWALTALFLLAGCGKKTPAGTWIIAADNDLSPFIYAGADGKAAGLDAEILEAIAEDQGFRYELRLSDWNTAMGVFTSHQAQVLLGSLASNQERADGGWYFSSSFYDGVTQSMAMEPSSDTNTLEDLAGKAVAVVSGSLGAEYAKSLKDQYGFSIATYKDSHAMYAAVLDGTAAACFEDTEAMRDSIESGIGLQMVESSESRPVGYCVAVCNAENRTFLELFDKGLENVKANGTCDRLLAKYTK